MQVTDISSSDRHYRSGIAALDQLPADETIPVHTLARNEASLIAKLKSGDNGASETFVRTHAPWMIAVAQRFLADRELAEDCVQEVFINAFRKIGDFEERSSLKTWLYHIVVNQALMKLRVMRKQKETSIDELLPIFDTNGCRIEGSWQRLAPLDEILERKDRRVFILSKINELPAPYRLILQLRDIEELTTREVAEKLCMSEANVKVRLHRARSALKKLLEPVLKGEL